MRLLTIVTPLTLIVLEATGAAVNLARGLSQSDVIHTLTSNPNLLPESCGWIVSTYRTIC